MDVLEHRPRSGVEPQLGGRTRSSRKRQTFVPPGNVFGSAPRSRGGLPPRYCRWRAWLTRRPVASSSTTGFAAQDLDVGMGGREPVGDGEELPVEHVVGVAERHPLAGRVLEAEVSGRGLAAVRLGEDRHEARPAPRPVLEDAPGAVRRAVVDRDHLDPPEVEPLRFDRGDEVGQVRLDVVDRAHDREARTRRGQGRCSPRVIRAAACAAAAADHSVSAGGTPSRGDRPGPG